MEVVSFVFLTNIAYIAILYYFFRSVYRLYFHPLAHIPGPKLAAITHKWMAYHDLVHFGKLIFKIEELHKQYGPVVRIGPDELHIFDIDSYNEIFKSGTKFNVDVYIHQNPIFRGSLLGVPKVQDAKPRRDAYLPYFSKQSVRKLEPLLQNITDRLFANLDRHMEGGRTIDLTRAFRCFTLEVVAQYCFAARVDAVSTPNFRHPMIQAFLQLPKAHRPKQYFPKLYSLIEAVNSRIPYAWLKKMNPVAADAMNFIRNQNAHIDGLSKKDPSQNDQITVFDSVLRPSAKEKAQVRLSLRQIQSDAGLFLAAGMDTTAHALEMGIWGFLNRPKTLHALLSELKRALPNRGEEVRMEQVENLAYLNAVIKESLRLAYGVPGRLLRIVPSGGHVAAGVPIPAETTVGHSAYLYHTDEDVFKMPYEFSPERWLGSDVSGMESHLLSFSRGSRNCVGMNLAYAELYIMFARFVMRYEVTNAGTTEKDMEWIDGFVSLLDGSLKVRLTERAI